MKKFFTSLLFVSVFVLSLTGACFAQSGKFVGSFVGTWASDCTPLQKRHAIHSAISFSDTRFLAEHILYADQKCQEPTVKIEYVGEYFTEHGEFEWMPSIVVQRILNKEALAYYNEKKICGIGDWKLAEPRDVAGLNCDPVQMPAKDTIYDEGYGLHKGRLTFESFPSIPGAKVRVLGKPLVYSKY